MSIWKKIFGGGFKAAPIPTHTPSQPKPPATLPVPASQSVSASGHRYNVNGFCELCGWERRFIEKNGRTCTPQTEQSPPRTSARREVYLQEAGSPRIFIDPNTISYAYVALTHEDARRFSQKAAGAVADLNRMPQPMLWSVPFTAKFGWFSSEAGAEGFPSPHAIPVALERVGVPASHSIVVNQIVVSFDGGTTHSKVHVGFAFPEPHPRLIIPEPDGILPK